MLVVIWFFQGFQAMSSEVVAPKSETFLSTSHAVTHPKDGNTHINADAKIAIALP